MASNRLKLKGEPFSGLQSLKFLDVSMNNLQSAKLGSEPQLPSLVSLSLASNDFTELKREDFSFLNQSSFLQVLNLSSTSLKKLESGCFKPVSGLHTLILDQSNIGTLVISKVCSELSHTAIDVLSLQKMKLITLTNTTFKGLEETNLTFLDLSTNNLTKIEEGSFKWLPRLKTLVLSENNIKHVTQGTFQGLKELKKLQLTKALVKTRSSSVPIIDDFSFQALGALETLLLQRTSVRQITENTFSGLRSLTELDMSWSSYASLKKINRETFSSLSNSPLMRLNLVGTAISHLYPGSFSVLKNLTFLFLDHNFINQTLTGQEFEGLSQLEELHMISNFQTIQLTSQSFVGMTGLKVLTLGKSLRAMALNVSPSPFKPLANLAFLDLSNNNIANIKDNLLEGLSNLKVLNLQHNNLAQLWKSSNVGGPVLFLKNTPRLTTLHLDYNGLDEIPVEALKDLTNLKELSLSNNLLNSLKDSVFDNLKSLKVFSLVKNSITTVRPEVFKAPLSNLSLLLMDRNPFDCTCESILWFVTWLKSRNKTSVPDLEHQYVCNTPPTYFNRTIIKFDPLSCKDMAPFQALFILSSTAVLMLMVTALLVRFHGWRIQFYWNILIGYTLGLSDAKVEEGREFEYDAYVIHAAADAGWVERRIEPLENERCRFCLEDRDSIPGMSQLESIVNNMRKCRKILFVVTESLLLDPWCRQFKAHHALNQVIEASRDSIILVFLQDVHDYKLSRSLFLRRGMLRPCCILDWPVYKERVPAFHQKLFIALGMTNKLQE
ncbi:toll-like receptor 3 isoform X2 [Salarias fasciatus]|nr:toll-like receptor 3 isoform X2 [Salarias fasciatus]